MINLSKLKKAYIKKRFNKLLLEKEEYRVVSQNVIKTIAVISSDEISNWIDLSAEVEKHLGVKVITIYSYRSLSLKNEKSNKHFSEKYFNWKGQVSEPNFKLFLNQPYDLLIGYFNKKNLYVENAILHSNAKFKVGIAKVNQQLYDLEIDTFAKNSDEFLIELKKYLIILKKL